MQFKLRGRTSRSTSGEEVGWAFVAEDIALGSILRGQGFGRNWEKTLVALRCGGRRWHGGEGKYWCEIMLEK